MNKLFIIGILLLTTSCEEDANVSTLDEINIVAQGDCMSANLSDLNAVLCITDMEGNAKTFFGQNENFIISLTFRNNSRELVKIKEEYLANEGVLTVMGAENSENFGKPFNSVACQFDGNPYMEVPSGETYVVSSPWVLEEGIATMGPVCKSENNEYLAVGSYRVVVSLKFTMEMGSESISVEGGNELSLEFNIM